MVSILSLPPSSKSIPCFIVNSIHYLCGEVQPSNKYFFIVNPISGQGKGKTIIPLIEKIFTEQKINYSIQITSFAGEGKQLAEMAIQNEFTHIIAVGGDGTVNEVAGKVAGTPVVFGIIPIGSGNGLAREMNIPLDSKAAIKNLLAGETKKIDTGICNEHFFVCTAGIGFDAHLADKFLRLEKRGLSGYVKAFLQEYFSYQPGKYQFKTDDKTIESEAFLITIANCRQWGNEFYISPQSKPNDGYLDICILKKFPLVIFPFLIYRIICKTIHKSRYFEVIRVKKAEISIENSSFFHTDGEVSAPQKIINIELKPSNLVIISNY